MDNLNLVKKLPPMLTGLELERALTILPEYDPGIKNENTAARLIALSDMYKVFGCSSAYTQCKNVYGTWNGLK